MNKNIINIFIAIYYFQQIKGLCVWAPMLTRNLTVCHFNNNNNCSEHWLVKARRKREEDNTYSEQIPLLRPGSVELSHFSSVKDDSPLPEFVYAGINTTCDIKNRYRTYDGSCNNLKNPNWGRANYEMIRLLKPRYSGINGQPAKSVTGAKLPNARLISVKLFNEENKPSLNHTLIFMQWGQLMAHDVAKSPSVLNAPLDCCSKEGQSSDKCYPISISRNDTFYKKFDQTCLSMVRTKVLYKKVNCTIEPFQIAAVSQNFDASELYGSSKEKMSSVRTFQNGFLDYHVNSEGQMFPKLSDNPEKDCNALYSNVTCFHSGDSRVNQNIQLTCVQTLLLREHNRIAKILAEVNPLWNDEELFQETRRILIAKVQHITYNEYVPLLLGEKYSNEHKLKPLKEGFTVYNDKINFATINSFAAGAFRVFHSQIQGNLSMYSSSGCPYKTLFLSQYMNRPGYIMENQTFDNLIRGLTKQPPQKVDNYFTKAITNYLFQDNLPYGEDLESFDIQRGRDHGIASYNEMRELCGLRKVVKFSDLVNEIPAKNVEALNNLYASVDDIDFFVGALLEKPTGGSTSGPTLLCILGEQFARKKYGDRFWYEHGNLNHSFTEEQLQNIRKSSLSRLICDNSENITEIQPSAFFSPENERNNISRCSDLPSVDLSKWKV